MTRTKRRLIFYLFILIFVLATPATIFYASGFSFDWQNWQLLKTGSFYFDSLPKEANISIKDLPDDTTPAYIGRLLPRRYAITISKDSFQDWNKNLDITPQVATEARSIFLAPKEPKITKVADNATSALEYFLTAEQKITEQKILENASSTIAQAAAWKIFKNNFYFIQKSNLILYKTDSLGRVSEQISSQPLQTPSGQYQIIISDQNSLIFIPGGKLYLLDKTIKTFDVLADAVLGAEFSNDNEKLLYWTKNEIWVLWLSDVWSQPYRKAGEKELITRLSENIGQAAWFSPTNEHIIYTVKKTDSQAELGQSPAKLSGQTQIKITELDDRDQRNTFDIYSGNISESYFNPNVTLLYTLSEGKLYSIDLLEI